MKKYILTSVLAKRKKDSHKGNYGKVLLLGGSPGLTGAIYLCGQAASNTGSGLVTLGVPRALESILECKTSAVMTRGLVCTRQQQLSEFCMDELMQEMDRFDALGFGPGIGRGLSTQRLLWKLLEAVNIPMVIDADGLHLVASDLSQLKKRKAVTIVTPHLGEMARLTGNTVASLKKSREESAANFATKYQVIVLLKGPETVITDGEQIYVNKTGNPLLASGGTGDVLTGIIVSLLGQGKKAMDATALGAYLHGIAGDMATTEGRAVLPANELLKNIEKSVEKCQK